LKGKKKTNCVEENRPRQKLNWHKECRAFAREADAKMYFYAWKKEVCTGSVANGDRKCGKWCYRMKKGETCTKFKRNKECGSGQPVSDNMFMFCARCDLSRTVFVVVLFD